MIDWLICQLAPVRRIATKEPPVRVVRAKYDSALTTDNNHRHWANTDGLSTSTANGGYFPIRR